MDPIDSQDLEPPRPGAVVDLLTAEQAVLAHAKAVSHRIVERVRDLAGGGSTPGTPPGQHTTPAFRPGDRVLVTTAAGELPGVVASAADCDVFAVRVGRESPCVLVVHPGSVRPDPDGTALAHVVFADPV